MCGGGRIRQLAISKYPYSNILPVATWLGNKDVY